MLSNSGIGVQRVAGDCLASSTIQWVPQRPSSLGIPRDEVEGNEVVRALCVGQLEAVYHFVQLIRFGLLVTWPPGQELKKNKLLRDDDWRFPRYVLKSESF